MGNAWSGWQRLQPGSDTPPTRHTHRLRSAIGWMLLAPCLTATAAFAVDADRDAGFGSNGLVINADSYFDVGGTDYFIIINSVAIQNDGKIIVVGNREGGTPVAGVTPFQLFIARYTETGQLDTGFAGTGYLIDDIVAGSNNAAWEVLVQVDGKILVGGATGNTSAASADAFIVRYHIDGSRDLDFASGGVRQIIRPDTDESLLGMVIRQDGRIVIGGSTNPGNSFDTFFAQFTSNGDLDTGFSGDGVAVHNISVGSTDNASGIDLYPDGRLAFTGATASGTSAGVLVGRLALDGSLDTTFNNTGFRQIQLNPGRRDIGDEIRVLSDGGLAISVSVDEVANNQASLGVLKLHENGSTDADFGVGGLRTIAPEANRSLFNVSELAIQPDGKLLVAGIQAEMTSGTEFTIDSPKLVYTRLNANGSIDTTFDGEDGIVRENYGYAAARANTLVLQPDGKLVLAGRALVTMTPQYNSALIVRLGGTVFDVEPEPIAFSSQLAVAPFEQLTSNIQTISGLDSNALVPVRISNGEYSRNGGAFTPHTGWLKNGDTISLRHTAVGTGETETITTVNVGGQAIAYNDSWIHGNSVTATFTSRTRLADANPDPFSFAAQTDTLLDFWLLSEIITINGIDVSVPIGISNGEYSIDCSGTFTSVAGIISNGQTVCLRHRTAATVSTVSNSTLTVGMAQAIFQSTTAAVADGTPDPFVFIDVTGQGRNVQITSNTVTISGLTMPANLSVSGSGGYSIGCNGTFSNIAGTVHNGQTICLRHNAASSYSIDVGTTLTIGGVTDTFSSTTSADPGSGGGGGGGGGGSISLAGLLLWYLARLRARRQNCSPAIKQKRLISVIAVQSNPHLQ